MCSFGIAWLRISQMYPAMWNGSSTLFGIPLHHLSHQFLAQSSSIFSKELALSLSVPILSHWRKVWESMDLSLNANHSSWSWTWPQDLAASGSTLSVSPAHSSTQLNSKSCALFSVLTQFATQRDQSWLLKQLFCEFKQSLRLVAPYQSSWKWTWNVSTLGSHHYSVTTVTSNKNWKLHHHLSSSHLYSTISLYYYNLTNPLNSNY